MAEIKKNHLPKLIQSNLIQSGVRAFLVHGSDAGAVREVADKVAGRGLTNLGAQCEVITIDDDTFSSNPYALGNAIETQSMFSPKTLIRLRQVNAKISEALIASQQHWNENCFIVAESDSLRKDNALRRWFEKKSTDRAILAMYEDTSAEIRTLAASVLKKAALSVNDDVLDTIVSRLGSNRLVARRELEKLILYAHSDKSVTHEHLEAVFYGSEIKSISRLIDTTFSGNTARFEASFHAGWELGVGSIVLLNAAMRQCVLLEGAIAASKKNLDRFETLHLLAIPNSPIFWSIERQAAKWNNQKLRTARELICKASIAARNSHIPQFSATHRCLRQVTQLAARS